MSKRISKTVENASQPKNFKHWSMGLLSSMNDPSLVINETENLVVIKDKYPKAKIHYLVLPKEDIPSIYQLDSSHMVLLQKLSEIYNELVMKHSGVTLKAGFHAVPSMQRLHMHVISNDMISPCLKRKQHWNSFTTSFFRPLEDLISELKENNSIKKMSPEESKQLLATPLMCNQCCFIPKTMPQLKEHLLGHKKK